MSPAPELRSKVKPHNNRVLPKRPVRKRPKQKEPTHFDDELEAPIGNADESVSEKEDSEPPSRSKKKPTEKVKQTEKSKQKSKNPVKKSTETKSSKNDASEEAEPMEKITGKMT